MTALRDILAEADPVRHEVSSGDAERARVRHAVLAAALHVDAKPRRHARRQILIPVLVTFASIVGISLVTSSMWPRTGSLVQAAVRFEVRLAENQPAPGLRAARVGNSNRIVYLHPDSVVTNSDIARSSVIAGDTPSHFWIDVRLNDAGAEKMRRATATHLGQPVAILIDGDVVTAPTLKSPIGAAAVISGDYTQADAERIANGMTTSP